MSIDSSTGLVSGTVQYGAAEDFDGTYNPTIIVANNQGGSTTTTFSWTINQAQVAPTLSSPGNQINLTGDNVSLQINATQADNDPISYDASNLPDGLDIDPDSGIISGTVAPDAATGLPYAVTVTATDDSTNLSSSVTFNWTITASTAAPTWTAPGNQSNSVGDEVDLQLSASDANEDTLTYTATGLPPGLTLDPIEAAITGTLSSSDSGTYSVTVTASNGISSSSQSFTWTVSPISLQNPGDQSNLDGDTVSLPITATDANNDTLSYSATGLPPGLSIDSGSGLISGTINDTADANSPYSVTVTASDSDGNSASQSFNWTVAALALNPVDDQENQEGTSVSLQVSATDNVGTPTYSATGLPDGVSINATTGLITGTVGLGAFGSSPYQVTVTATDGANTSSQSFVWTVTPRVALVNPGPQSNASGDSVSLQVTATSPGGTMSYSATGLPDGLSINSSTGLISGTIAAVAVSDTPYNVTVTANDGTSSSSQTFQWTVSVINLESPGDQTNNDGDTVSLPLTTGYNGSGTLSYSATGLPPGLSINSSTGQITGTISNTADTNSPYSATVTVTDGTNTSSQTFNWTVNAVVSVDPIDDQSNADGDSVSLQVSAEDSLNNTLTYSATGLPPGLTIASTTGLISGTISAGADTSSPYAVTVTATDSAGLSASQSFNWDVAAVGLVNPGPQSSVDDQAVSLQLQGSSGATYTAAGLPPGLSISSTGLISGTLASNADTNSPYVVTVTATLGNNNVSQTFLWMVTPIGLVAPSDQTNTEGDSVSLQLQGLSNGGSLTYSASGLPDGLSLNPTTGLIVGTIAPGAAADGPFTVDVAVTNGTVSASQSFNWNINPVVNLTAPDDQSNNEGDNVTLQVTATDSLNNTLTYSADGLPPGLSINSSTGLISGTISAGDAANGPYVVTVTASDGTYSSSQTFNWNIAQTNPTTPTMTNPGPQTNVVGDSVNLQINASDADGDALTYSATGLPDGLDIDPNLGIISGTVADDAVSTTPYPVTVTASDPNGLSDSQTFTWLINAPTITAQAVPMSAIEGNDTGSIIVATFTTTDLSSQAADFTATVNWGDGSSPDVIGVSGGNGSFTVTDDYIYAENGSYPISVTITDTVTGASTTVTTTATVTDAALTLTGGFQLGAIPQQSSNLTLATFTDGNLNAGASDYTATINWGDGSGSQPATVTAIADGEFSISGSHAYSQNGNYTATITVTGADGATATTTSTVAVGDVYAGIPSNLTVASFTDADTSIPASSFTATINWGDGTPSSSGTVTGGNGTFTVQGTHTYAQDSIDQSGGVYQVTVTVTDQSGDTLTASSTVTVVRPPMTVDAGGVEAPLNSMTLTNVQVAAFTEPDTTDGTDEFSAMIYWGDNSSSAGTIQEVSPGLFEVLGTHTYAVSEIYPITVYVDQGWQEQLLAAAAGPQGQAGDEDTWKPTVAGNLASNPKNWSLGFVPNNKKAFFNKNVSNARIVWDQNISPSLITLEQGYTGQQIINPGVTIASAYGISMDAKDQLNVDFKEGVIKNPNLTYAYAALEVDGGSSTLTTVVFTGQGGTFLINNGATVDLAQGKYTEQTAATIKVASPEINSTLNIGNKGTLTFTSLSEGLEIDKNGIVNLNGGAGTTMIQGRLAGNFQGTSNNVINVNGGELNWTGSPGETDVLAMAVVVKNGGTFNLNGKTKGKGGGWLSVEGIGPAGQAKGTGGLSVFVADGTVSLSGGATLWAWHNYTQDAGILQTTDQYAGTLLTGIGRNRIAVGAGTVNILGGTTIKMGNAKYFGTLNVYTFTLNMGGTYDVSINPKASNGNDALHVYGGREINQAGSVLNVNVVGKLDQQDGVLRSWTILTATDTPLFPVGIKDFTTEKLNGTSYKIVPPSPNNPGKFILYFQSTRPQ